MKKNFYVYIHYRNDNNVPFYVGKGTGNRYQSKTSRNTHWNNIVNKVGYRVDIVEDNLTEEESFIREKYYIQLLGRETLCNMTDGGEGSSGREPWNKGKKGHQVAWNKGMYKEYKLNIIRSQEFRKKMSELHKDKIVSDETKKKMSESKKGKFIAEKNPFYGKTHSEETKKKLSENQKGKKLSEEHKKKMSESMKGRKHSEESKKKMSESKKGEKSPHAKKVINTETGEIFDCMRVLANNLGYKYLKFTRMMNGYLKNKTPFQYYN